VFFAAFWKSGQFLNARAGCKALRLFCDYVVGELLLISTPYPTGVEYDCDFLAAFVQNVQKKLRKRLHTFFFNRISQ
jgi:hypothetical protein